MSARTLVAALPTGPARTNVVRTRPNPVPRSPPANSRMNYDWSTPRVSPVPTRRIPALTVGKPAGTSSVPNPAAHEEGSDEKAVVTERVACAPDQRQDGRDEHESGAGRSARSPGGQPVVPLEKGGKKGDERLENAHPDNAEDSRERDRRAREEFDDCPGSASRGWETGSIRRPRQRTRAHQRWPQHRPGGRPANVTRRDEARADWHEQPGQRRARRVEAERQARVLEPLVEQDGAGHKVQSGAASEDQRGEGEGETATTRQRERRPRPGRARGG